MRITRITKSDPKGFFQIFKSKNKERIGPLEKDEELIENS